jgi:hypothetical protein
MTARITSICCQPGLGIIGACKSKIRKNFSVSISNQRNKLKVHFRQILPLTVIPMKFKTGYKHGKLTLAVLDPDPYWDCGSGSMSMKTDQN